MTSRARLFGSAAAAYEEFRLGYPAEVVDRVLGYASRPVTTAFEIGAGTGKATRRFAERGIAVTASEPDAAMLEELRRCVDGSVTLLQASLEEARPRLTFDLVYVAAALHWTEEAGRWERIEALLEPGGTFACFGSPLRLADHRLEDAVRDAEAPEITDEDHAARDGRAELRWPGPELAASELFVDVEQVVVPRRLPMSREAFLGHRSTVSAYLALPSEVRSAVLDRVAAVLPDEVDAVADVILHLARTPA